MLSRSRSRSPGSRKANSRSRSRSRDKVRRRQRDNDRDKDRDRNRERDKHRSGNDRSNLDCMRVVILLFINLTSAGDPRAHVHVTVTRREGIKDKERKKGKQFLLVINPAFLFSSVWRLLNMLVFFR